jgi:hypothetical protein
MKKAAKKTRPVMTEFTTHTLWTAKCAKVQGKSINVQITPQLQEQLKKTLAASESALQQKLEAFEPVEIPDAAARCLIR